MYGFSGWSDDFRQEILVAFQNLHNPGRVLIGPWGHCQNDGFALVTERLRFFDRYLKSIPNGIENEPPILYYTIGAPAGSEWRQASEWPPRGQKPVDYFLADSHTLGERKPAGASAKDSASARYNAVCPQRANPLSQSCVLDDIGFTYSTAPLAHDMELTGSPVVHLWISAGAADMNFFAYLEDVAPDGKVTIATDGRLRASLRALSTPPYSNFNLPYHRMFEQDWQPLWRPASRLSWYSKCCRSRRFSRKGISCESTSPMPTRAKKTVTKSRPLRRCPSIATARTHPM